MGKSQRVKGHTWERQVAILFREALPGCGAKRGFQMRGGAAEEPDVMAGYYHVECKVGKKPPVRKALLTAVETCPNGKYPLAIIKEDRKTPYMVMELETFLELAAELWELQGR
jgi:hypothetical protein